MPHSPPLLTKLLLICFSEMMHVTLCLRELIGFPLCDVTVGEAVGLHTVMQWVSDLRFENVDFVLDSHYVDSFHTEVDDDSELCCIIIARRQLFQDSFQNSHVEFNKRPANVVAHELEMVAKSDHSPNFYDDVPSCI